METVFFPSKTKVNERKILRLNLCGRLTLTPSVGFRHVKGVNTVGISCVKEGLRSHIEVTQFKHDDVFITHL